MTGLPLAGVRVIEISSFVATPLCGLHLAQLGAEVIRVEPLGGAPDRGRWPLSPGGQSLYWNALNAGKRVVEVDLNDPAGRRLVADLAIADGSGIVVTNSDRWPELGHAALSAQRAGLIHALLLGRRDGTAAVDYTVQASTGLPLMAGPADHLGPVNANLPAWDITAGLQLVTGILSAELRRRATGEGAEIRLALEDVALTTIGHLGLLAEAQLSPSGRAPDSNFVYGTFGTDVTTADGRRYMLVALTGGHWRSLVQLTGIGPVIENLEKRLETTFAEEGERYRHRHVIAALVDSWFRVRDAATAEAALAASRLLWAPYRTLHEVIADDSAELRAHPAFGVVAQPGVGELVAPGSAISLDGRHRPPATAPRVGEHTRDVLAELLGLDDDRLDRLNDQGLIR